MIPDGDGFFDPGLGLSALFATVSRWRREFSAFSLMTSASK